MASYGAEFQHESTTFSLSLLLATERLKVIAAIHPGLWHPGVLPSSSRRLTPVEWADRGQRRQRLVQGEFTALGEPWLEHDERYRRSEEFIRVLKGSWTAPGFSFAGDFYGSTTTT